MKQYRRGTRALGGIDLEVEEGQTFGLLGPNGAGKSTFVKCLLGLLNPTSGSVRIFGKPAGDPQSRLNTGFAPETPRFPDFLSAFEVMRFHAGLAGLHKAAADPEIRALLEDAELTDAPKRVGAFSKGMVRKLALAQAFMSRPRLLVLDEPTSDLDPLGRRKVRNKLAQMKEEGVTVILNSHLLSEVERICDRVVIIHKGSVLASGTIEELVPEGQDLETVFADLIEATGR